MATTKITGDLEVSGVIFGELQADAGSVGISELADNVLAASAAGRGKMQDGFFDGSTVGSKFAAGAISAPIVADADGTGGLYVQKNAIVVYDFATDGGTQGAIALTGSPPLPDNALVYVSAYEVQTTLTSATDAATVTLGFPTDGNMFTAIAISDASNPWDQGGALMGQGALVAANVQPVKLTAARTLQLTVAGGEDVTAGKIIFYLTYVVSD